MIVLMQRINPELLDHMSYLVTGGVLVSCLSWLLILAVALRRSR